MKNFYLHIPLDTPDINNLVLATVTSTEGSTPQKPGSSALFNQDGLIKGTVGGGILEGKVQETARRIFHSKDPELHLFSLDSNISDSEGALCGGKISVLIDPCLSKHLPVLKAVRKSAEERIPGILITSVTKVENDIVVVSRYWITDTSGKSVPDDLKPFVEPEISILFRDLDSNDYREIRLPEDGKRPSQIILLEPVIQSPHLIIAGAGHIGKVLAQVAGMLDFEITVIDDRPEYANSENIPFANHIITDDIGKTIARMDKGKDTYIVIVTRGHKDDGNALKACIDSGAAYIGMIGSKNKVALMRREFIENGWATQTQWDRIFAPVGVDINSKTVEEIAVSIAAQLVLVRNNKLILRKSA
jgi:xanthine dehydrogenase accessory factor